MIIGGWEIAAHLVPESQLEGSPIVPSLEFIWTDTLRSLSGSWTIHRWAPNPAFGGRETYLGAVLAIGYHSYFTLVRVLLGLAVGGILGLATGFLVSYSRVMRWIVWGPLNFLRMVPLLAAIPPLRLLARRQHARNDHVHRHRRLGAARGGDDQRDRQRAERLRRERADARRVAPRTYVRVVVPAALPELRTGLLLAAGLSWSLGVGSEYIGLRTGLGSIMASAQATANTGRMIIMAVLIVAYALVTFALLDALFSRLVHWLPRRARSVRGVPRAPVGAAAAPVAVRAD